MIRAYLLVHVQAARRALKQLGVQPVTTVFSVLAIGIALALPLGLYAFLDNVVAAAGKFDADPHINVYLVPGAGIEDARAVEGRLKADTRMDGVTFISREEALNEMKRSPHLADLLASIDTNPLPHTFTMRPKTLDGASLEVLRKDLAALPKVEVVMMDFEWAQRLAGFARFAERLVGLLSVLLGATVIFVTGNTIRLQILTRREELEVSRLIGATSRFVRRPFLYFGALQGFLAGSVAALLVSAILWWASNEVLALTKSYGSDFSIHQLSIERLAWVVVGAALLGWLGAFISASAYFQRPDRR